MPIKTSSARQVDALVADLRGDDAVRRDAAVARLTVIGARAVERLSAVAGSATEAAAARIAAFRALEGIDDPRALTTAMGTLTSPQPEAAVVVAAVAVARAFLHGAHGVTALDALTALALDRRAADDPREAAVQAIAALDARTAAPILEALLVDSSARLRALAQGTTPPPAAADVQADTDSWLDHLDERELPADAAIVRHEIARRRDIPLPSLHRALEKIREREQQVPAAQRRGWLAARAAAHLVLAQRGSRVALYDLREILAHADGPQPWSDLLSAVAAIGDAECLELLAAIYARSAAAAGAGEPAGAMTRQTIDAFRAIVEREHVTARSAVAKKIAKRWPDAWKALNAR